MTLRQLIGTLLKEICIPSYFPTTVCFVNYFSGPVDGATVKVLTFIYSVAQKDDRSFFGP